MTNKMYIFTYGSLIYDYNSHIIPVNISGFKRGWNVQVPEDRNTGLGLIKSDKFSDYCNGLILEVTPDDLETYDQRELVHEYERILLDHSHVELINSNYCLDIDTVIWTYVAQNPKLPTSEYPISQSYLDVVLSGCLSINERFAINFINTTYGWDGVWINDRTKPRYRRNICVNKIVIDNFLHKHFFDLLIKRNNME